MRTKESRQHGVYDNWNDRIVPKRTLIIIQHGDPMDRLFVILGLVSFAGPFHDDCILSLWIMTVFQYRELNIARLCAKMTYRGPFA